MLLLTFIFTTVVTFVLIRHVTLNSESDESDLKSPCKPFSAFFIWHTGSGEDASFFQQSRLLVTLIGDIPENTRVTIVTIGAKDNIVLQFTKQLEDINWSYDILSFKPGKALNQVLSSAEIEKALSHYSRSHYNEAEIFYLLINSKTEIRDEQSGFKELRRKKIFVVLSEEQAESTAQNWPKLASNEHHYVVLKSGNEDIDKTKETIRTMSCEDSKFVCDTDMYWSYNSGRCNSCTYICSNSSNIQSEYCIDACPYFQLPWLDTNLTASIESSKEIVVVSSVFVTVLLFILIIVWRKQFFAVCKFCRPILFKKRYTV